MPYGRQFMVLVFFVAEGKIMMNDGMYWVLIAPGLTSVACFFTEAFVEAIRQRFEEIAPCRRRIW
jgi:hypothetical protein